jgi:hypothetical protein
MTIVAHCGTTKLLRVPFAIPRLLVAGALLATIPTLAPVQAYADDTGKKLCLPDAKRLCAAQMQSLSRAKVRACLIAHLQDTSPPCHDFMVAQRKAALSGHAPDPSAQ